MTGVGGGEARGLDLGGMVHKRGRATGKGRTEVTHCCALMLAETSNKFVSNPPFARMNVARPDPKRPRNHSPRLPALAP